MNANHSLTRCVDFERCQFIGSVQPSKSFCGKRGHALLALKADLGQIGANLLANVV
jgi:hypothetical protein